MTIKERVLHIAKQKGLQKVSFFQDLGISYANFKGPQKRSALSSDTLVTILQRYPDVDPVWLLMGEGTMMRTSVTRPEQGDGSVESNQKGEPLHAALQQAVSAQEKTITLLEQQVSLLEQELRACRK